jgi:hypothetical protein
MGARIAHSQMFRATSGGVKNAPRASRSAGVSTFANPHQVLEKAGTIPKGWKDDEGGGPEECERRLEQEGVELVDGKAPRERRTYHDELHALLEASEATKGAAA